MYFFAGGKYHKHSHIFLQGVANQHYKTRLLVLKRDQFWASFSAHEICLQFHAKLSIAWLSLQISAPSKNGAWKSSLAWAPIHVVLLQRCWEKRACACAAKQINKWTHAHHHMQRCAFCVGKQNARCATRRGDDTGWNFSCLSKEANDLSSRLNSREGLL